VSVEPSHLVAAVLAGDVATTARVCRAVDEGWPIARELLRGLYVPARAARVIGITGSPGVGKSTLVSALIDTLRARGDRVGVVAVDPSSPFTGGAVLGDRIRMQKHFADNGVFIRSLATRGALGGLSRSALDVARVLGAWGARWVIVETVGVGQDEHDITRFADCTVVVEAPGAGDDLQANKAGLLECAHLFVVNKADRTGAEATAAHLRAAVALGHSVSAQVGRGHGPVAHGAATAHGAGILHGETANPSLDAEWVPPVLLCVATQGTGVVEFVETIERFLAHPDAVRSHTQRLTEEVAWRLKSAVLERFEARIAALSAGAAEQVLSGGADPYGAAGAALEELGLT
jgi:LAO/AO transport system kinase